MIKHPVKLGIHGHYVITENAINNLLISGCYIPKIDQVIFNRGTRKDQKTGCEYPTLTTIIFFADGTKTVVTNSYHDSVVDENGEVTYCAKEAGIVNAICKRVLATQNAYDVDSGEYVMKSEGYGRVISDLVKNARDSQEEDKLRATRKAEKKERAEAQKQKASERKTSLKEVISQLQDAITMFTNTVKSEKPNFV